MKSLEKKESSSQLESNGMIEKYQKIFDKPSHFIKYKEKVFTGYESFTLNEVNYEITDKDLAFCA